MFCWLLSFAHHKPILDFHGARCADQNRDEGDEGADSKRGNASHGLANGAAHCQHAAQAHEDGANEVAGEVFKGSEPFDAKAPKNV